MAYEKSKFERMVKEAEQKSVSEMWAVRQHQPLPERIVKTAVGAALQSAVVRERALRYAKTSKDFPGHTRIGEGEDQTVFRRGDRVVKLLHSALQRYPDRSMEDIAHMLQTATDTCKPYMGRMWVPTDFDVVVLPVSGDEAVVARQPYIRSRASYRTMDVLAADPQVPITEKHRFAENAGELHHMTGLHVDVLGPHNVCLSQIGGLVVNDTLPISRELQQEAAKDGRTYGEHAQANLDMLRAA